MTQPINVQELAIVMVAPNHRPTMLNLEFLRCSSIVPEDWNVIRPPVNTQQSAQLIFQNGVSLTAQGNQISFMEPFATKNPQDVWVPKIIRQYVQLLPYAGYQAVGINLRGFVSFPVQEGDAARQFLTQKLLTPGRWQDYGQQPVKAGINLAYDLDGRQLYLSINEVTLQREAEDQAIPGLMFSGNFEYRLELDAKGDRPGNPLTQVLTILENWQADLTAYTDLINHHFLPKIKPQTPWGTLSLDSEAMAPELVPMS